MRLVLLIVFAADLRAQTETGQISGFVMDSFGHGVPFASVTATSGSRAVTRSVQTSGEGAYAITDLLPGPFTVRVSVPGFPEVLREIWVHTGSAVVENFRLEESRNGTTRQAGSNMASESDRQVIDRQDIESAPNLTRDPLWMAMLAANVSDAGLGTRGVGVAMNGQRESSTGVLLDGALNRNEFQGAIGQHVPLEAIEEISISTGGYQVRYGRASGGIVSAVTRTGTDRWHGSAYEFLRSSALAGNTFQANSIGIRRPVFDRNDFGY